METEIDKAEFPLLDTRLLRADLILCYLENARVALLKTVPITRNRSPTLRKYSVRIQSHEKACIRERSGVKKNQTISARPVW